MENGKYIFSIKKDICTANDKDVNATKLLEIMRTYGTVEDYNAHVATLRAEDKETIDNLVAQNEAIKEQNLSADEVELLNKYRVLKAAAVQKVVVENGTLKKQLEDIKSENETRNGKIAELLGIK